MAIQEKLSKAFDELKKGAFGETIADAEVVIAEKKLQKDPTTTTVDQLKTILALDVLKIFSAYKGVEGLSKALTAIEAQYPANAIKAIDQRAIDTISTEIERQLNAFSVEKESDQLLFKEVGMFVKNKNWMGAAKLIETETVNARARGDITGNEHAVINKSLRNLRNGNSAELIRRIGENSDLNDRLHDPKTGEILKQTDRVAKLEIAVTRRSLGIMRQTTIPIDVEPNLTLEKSVINKKAKIIQETEALRGKAGISLMDTQILKRFQQEIDSKWADLENGLDLENWSREDEAKERLINEVNGIVNHVLYLESKNQLAVSDPEYKKYLIEVQKSTSAVKRLWKESAVKKGEVGTPIQQLTPQEDRAISLNRSNLEVISQLQNGENFAAWARAQRNWRPEDLAEEGISPESVLMEMEARGLLKYKNGVVTWLKSKEAFFDEVSQLARDVSAIVPEVNQIPFSRSLKPRLYQMLMESEAPPGKREDLGWSKDAVFRLYTMGYVKESLWRNGGNLEALCKAALGLLGQGGEDSVYSSLFHFNETIRNIGSGILNEDGKEVEIIKLDLRDMLDFSEYYSRLKDGKRSWLNAISSGNLNQINDGTTLSARKDFFKDYMKWVLDRELDMGLIDVAKHSSKMTTIDNHQNYERIFDVYGGHYTNMVKVFESIHLRYGQAAVNQVTSGDAFEFCSPPGGEAPYKFHKNTVFKFNARYVGGAKFAHFLDGKVDTGMVSAPAYFRKETVPHFLLAHSEVGSNPGADNYFFTGVTNGVDKKRYSEQFVNFWKPAIFDSDDHGGKYRDTDEIRMVADTISIALQRLDNLPANQLSFISNIDYKMISRASGFDFDRIFAHKGITNPKEKFKYFIEHWGNRYYEWNTLRSKRVADFYNSYVQKSYNDVRNGALALSINATSEEAIMAIATAHDAYNPATGFIEDIHDNVIEQMNHRPTFLGIPLPPLPGMGLRLPKTEFGKGWKNVGMKGEKSAIDLNGRKESSLKGLIPGALKRSSYIEYFTRRRDPEWMRPLVLESAYQAGELSPELFEKRMKEYKSETYFGPKVGKKGNLRWGHIFPPATAFYFIKGYLVDKLHLDWEDILYITKKTNEKALEDAKKAQGIKF